MLDGLASALGMPILGECEFACGQLGVRKYPRLAGLTYLELARVSVVTCPDCVPNGQHLFA